MARSNHGDVVAIVGGDQVGLAALLTAQFFAPAEIIMIDLDDNRLAVSQKFDATKTINSGDGKAVDKVMAMTENRGVDVAIEVVGIPATFDICQQIIAPRGVLANVGVHGKPVNLALEKLWIQNITITTGLVDTYTTPMLLKTVKAEKISPGQLTTHHFDMDNMMDAYDTFSKAAEYQALKVIIKT